MEKDTYKVILQEGTTLGNLRLNGNNYISKIEITAEMFAGNLSTVTVEGPDGAQTYHDMKLVQISKVGKEWWFILAEKTDQEKLKEKLREKLEAAMASNAEDITSVQLALAEIFEMMINGGI